MIAASDLSFAQWLVIFITLGLVACAIIAAR